MHEALLVLVSMALLLTAASLFLWQWAKGRQKREAIERHLNQQIKSRLGPQDASLPTPRTSFIDSAALAAGTDPWIETGEPTATTVRKSPLQALMPGWLEGVVTARTLILVAISIVILSFLAGALVGWVGGIAAPLLLLLFSAFALWFRVQKFRRQLISQLPAFIDSMVRLITIGNSTQAAFQLAIASTAPPLRGYLERASSLVRAGVDLDRALHQMAINVHVEEMYLLASILGLGVRYGGRADLLLERVANFMRDREQAQHELVAMSSETRLSAWILGLLPVGVGGFIIMANPGYFMRMWQDSTGQMLIFGAVGLQMLGAVLLYRLAKLT